MRPHGRNRIGRYWGRNCFGVSTTAACPSGESALVKLNYFVFYSEFFAL